MLIPFLAFIVGGHTFVVPTAFTPISGLTFPVNLSDRRSYRAVGQVTQAAAGGQGLVQCSPDAGGNWYTVVTVSLAATGNVQSPAAADKWDKLPTQCAGFDVLMRVALQNGGNNTAKMTSFMLEVQ